MDGKRDGKGVYVTSNGNKYEGQFVANKVEFFYHFECRMNEF
jgi:hypothetical protein